MRIRYPLVIALVLITLFLFSSCRAGAPTSTFWSGSTGAPRGSQYGNLGQQRQNTDQYFTGFEGIFMQFMPNLPPITMYEGDRFEAVVELRNLGRFPEKGAPEGKLYISGFDKQAINGIWEDFDQFPESLPGKSPVNPLGGQALKVYRDREVRVPFDNARYDSTVQVTACYKYRTIATPVVCVDPEPGNRIPNKACVPRTVALAGGQGAPVAVTRVEPRITHDGLYYTIYISNVGRGKVVQSKGFQRCPFNLDYTDVNRVVVHAEMAHDKAPECSPEGTSYQPVILQNNGQGVITCRFENPGGDAYTTPLNIQIDYVYSESIRRNIEILNLDYLR